MKVPARDSVTLIGRWNIGSLYFCENYDNPDLVPDDALKTWKDSGTSMCLRPQAAPLTSKGSGWSKQGRIKSTTSGCVWTIGVETMVKVQNWTESTQLEGRTIKFINDKCPQVPTTKVIHEWVDPAWNRSFMIMRRAPGVTLMHVWYDMTSSQRQDIADQVAVHIKSLAQHTSSKVETVQGLGVVDLGTVIGQMPRKLVPKWPSWKQWRHSPFTRDAFIAHLRYTYDCTSVPDVGKEFVLYNPDINNVIVKWPEPGKKGELVQIIDWDFTGYWPRYCVASCPSLLHPFYDAALGKPTARWGPLLQESLKKLGFKDEVKWFLEHEGDYDRLMDERAGSEFHEFIQDLRRESALNRKNEALNGRC